MYISISGQLQLVKQHLDPAEPQPVASTPPDAPLGHQAIGRFLSWLAGWRPCCLLKLIVQPEAGHIHLDS